MRARELGRKGIVVGDEVHLVGDTSGADGSLARIVRVAPRETVLRRTADDTDPVERVLVANADQLVVVSALANPEPRPRLIDRCLVAAYDAGMEPLLVLTKADLTDPAPFLEQYAPLSVRHVVTARHDGTHRRPRRAARGARPGRVSVLVGHSGRRQVHPRQRPGAPGPARHRRRQRRHRPGSAHLVLGRRPGAARRRRLGHRHPGRPVLRAGPRRPGAGSSSTSPTSSPAPQQCPRGCTHDEEECALDAWVDERRRRARRAGAPGLAAPPAAGPHPQPPTDCTPPRPAAAPGVPGAAGRVRRSVRRSAVGGRRAARR